MRKKREAWEQDDFEHTAALISDRDRADAFQFPGRREPLYGTAKSEPRTSGRGSGTRFSDFRAGEKGRPSHGKGRAVPAARAEYAPGNGFHRSPWSEQQQAESLPHLPAQILCAGRSCCPSRCWKQAGLYRALARREASGIRTRWCISPNAPCPGSSGSSFAGSESAGYERRTK